MDGGTMRSFLDDLEAGPRKIGLIKRLERVLGGDPVAGAASTSFRLYDLTARELALMGGCQGWYKAALWSCLAQLAPGHLNGLLEAVGRRLSAGVRLSAWASVEFVFSDLVGEQRFSPASPSSDAHALARLHQRAAAMAVFSRFPEQPTAATLHRYHGIIACPEIVDRLSWVVSSHPEHFGNGDSQVDQAMIFALVADGGDPAAQALRLIRTQLDSWSGAARLSTDRFYDLVSWGNSLPLVELESELEVVVLARFRSVPALGFLQEAGAG